MQQLSNEVKLEICQRYRDLKKQHKTVDVEEMQQCTLLVKTCGVLPNLKPQ